MMNIAIAAMILLASVVGGDLLVLHIRRQRQRRHIKAMMRSHMQAALDGDEHAIRQVTEASQWLRQRGL